MADRTPVNKTFSCDLCGSSYKRKNTLTRHIGAKHGLDSNGHPLTAEQQAAYCKNSTRTPKQSPKTPRSRGKSSKSAQFVYVEPSSAEGSDNEIHVKTPDKKSVSSALGSAPSTAAGSAIRFPAEKMGHRELLKTDKIAAPLVQYDFSDNSSSEDGTSEITSKPHPEVPPKSQHVLVMLSDSDCSDLEIVETNTLNLPPNPPIQPSSFVPLDVAADLQLSSDSTSDVEEAADQPQLSSDPEIEITEEDQRAAEAAENKLRITNTEKADSEKSWFIAGSMCPQENPTRQDSCTGGDVSEDP